MVVLVVIVELSDSSHDRVLCSFVIVELGGGSHGVAHRVLCSLFFVGAGVSDTVGVGVSCSACAAHSDAAVAVPVSVRVDSLESLALESNK